MKPDMIDLAEHDHRVRTVQADRICTEHLNADGRRKSLKVAVNAHIAGLSTVKEYVNLLRQSLFAPRGGKTEAP